MYFMLTAGLVMPITLCVTDVVRGLTAKAIAVRNIVALVSGVTYLFWMLHMNKPISLSFTGPLVASAVSDLFLRDRRKNP